MTKEDSVQLKRDTRQLELSIMSAAITMNTQMGQRKGQALMNALRHRAPELYEIISGTEADCFFDDKKLDLTCQELGFNRGLLA